ncbi:MAG: hypothetical protein DDT22_00989 [candidate division WS2 bacterium]|nr:hypothetical protein [Candidatus Lithacetigena glycinireducens]
MVRRFINQKTVLFIAILFLFSSCSSVPKKKVSIDLDNVKARYSLIEPVRDVLLGGYPVIVYDDGLRFLDKPVSVRLGFPVPLADFLNMLVAGQGYNLVIYGAEEINRKSIYVSNFQGSLGSLLSDISKNYGLFIQFKNGTISVKQEDTFFVSLFRHFDIDKHIEKQITSLGGKQVSYDIHNQRLIFTSDKKVFNRINDYLRSLSKDFSFINLHLVLIDVEESRSKTHGINIYRSIFDLSLSQLALDAAGLRLKSSQDGSFSLLARDAGLSVDLFLYYLKQNASYRILQDIQIGMINTYSGKIESFQKIPYIDRVFLADTPVGARQGVDVKEVDAGSSVEISSTYDFDNNLLFISVNAVYRSFLRYISLTTGQVTFNRPLISKRLLNTHLVMSPYEMLVIGGVSSESETLAFDGIDSVNIGTNKASDLKSRLVILIKPQVTRFVYTKAPESAPEGIGLPGNRHPMPSGAGGGS